MQHNIVTNPMITTPRQLNTHCFKNIPGEMNIRLAKSIGFKKKKKKTMTIIINPKLVSDLHNEPPKLFESVFEINSFLVGHIFLVGRNQNRKHGEKQR